MLSSVQSRCTVTPFQQSRSSLPRRTSVLQRPVRCTARKPEGDKTDSPLKPFALPFTAAVAAALVFSAGSPDEALAARSGGRVGGSQFRSSRPAPAPSGGGGGGSQSGPTIRNYNYHNYSPPPLYGGYGGPGFGFGGGGGGITFMPSFGVPVVGGGSFFTIIFGLFLLSTVLSIARSIGSRGRRDDDY